MRKAVLILTVALLSSVMFYSCKPSDEKLQKAVEAVLSTKNLGVETSVKDGVVTINGTVDSEESKTIAETLAKSIKNVKSVTNNIQVNSGSPAVTINPDNTLSTIINTAFSAAGFSGVSVAVNNGEVTLTGDVKKADLAKIMQLANEAKPAKVINKLNLQ